ncbi:hypothetical protein [Sporomusa malonica]|uniref:Uncharacterized protein n=1 Tax=Sporomusa malonica TaxID=112901 RepID=A0A1W2AT92_9FIRM|nr:hypothetical protein [Sporomusa malonica]SMC63814.1 hypothetical protein SAMN04488500_10692 [Sporomusa malonica]
MDAKLTPEQSIEILRDNTIDFSPRLPGIKPISIQRANEIASLLESQSQEAELGRAAEKGYCEIIPFAPCKGNINSKECHEVAEGTRGCVLQYYCRELAARAGHR